MKLLNAGAGGHRPQDEHWWNLDTLKNQLIPGSPEMTNLLAEPRYIESDLQNEGIPFLKEEFDGILIQHVLEHMSCDDAAMVLDECRRVLKPGGWLCASVPDADYFMDVRHGDTRENAIELFGEPISEPQYDTFFDYALFHRDHVQILTATSLHCLLRKAGFHNVWAHQTFFGELPGVQGEIYKQLNRLKFSAILWALK